MEIELACDKNSEEISEKWGKTGQARGCSDGPTRQGMWAFRDEGYLNLEGFYENGRKQGTWTVFNQDGTVFARIYFDNGRKTGKQYF
jgi:antitoxin component YwqK of YwqJK toxin-antitoxin module